MEKSDEIPIEDLEKYCDNMSEIMLLREIMSKLKERKPPLILNGRIDRKVRMEMFFD